MVTNNALFLEGQSIVRPPMLNGVSFDSWRDRMKIFLQSRDIKFWYIVNEVPYKATIVDEELSKIRQKTRNELST